MSVDTVPELTTAPAATSAPARELPRRLRAGVVALAAAAVAVACAAVAFVGPADVQHRDVTWRPARDGLDRPLPLLGGYPQRLTVTTSCATIRGLPGETTLAKTALNPTTTSALALVATPSSVRLGVGPTTSLLHVAVPAQGPCRVTARFTAGRNVGSFTLRAGHHLASRTVPHHLADVVATEASWPRVVALHADPSVHSRTDLVVRLETTPVGSSPTTRQVVAEAAALLALAIAGTALLRGGRRHETRASGAISRGPRSDPSPLVTASDGVIAGAALVAALLTPPFWDDGWVRATVGGYSRLGFFSNYYTQADFAQPLGYWWAWLTHLWSGNSDALVGLRIVPVLLVVAAWWVLRRYVLDVVVSRDSRWFVRSIAGVVFAAGTAAFLLTLRPEPMIALLEVVALAAVVCFARRPGPRPLLALGVLVSLALTAHQTGWVVALTALTVVPAAVRRAFARDRLTRLTSLLAITAFSSACALLLLGLDTDAALTRSGIASFRAGDSYRIGVLDMARQRFDYLQFVAGLQRFWPMVAAIGALLFVVAVFRVGSAVVRALGYGALGGCVGLLLTGSPWPWHMGAVAPAAAVLTALGASALLARGRAGIALLGAAGVATALAAVWAMRTARPWTAGDLADHSWRDIPHAPLWVWLGFAAVAAAIGATAARRRATTGAYARHGAVLAGAALLVLGPVALTWGLLVVDATATSGWSFTRQALDEVTGSGTCGVADFVRVVRDATPLVETAVATGSTAAGVAAAKVDAYPSSKTGAVVPGRSPVWGTYGTRFAGAVATPWFAVRGAREIVFWTLGQTDAPDRVRVEVATTDARNRERIVTRAPEPAMSTAWWAYHEVRLAARARAVRIVLTDRTSDDATWVATTAPFVPRFASFTSITRQQAVWRNPNEVQAMPCRALPGATNGVYDTFRFSLGPPVHNGAAIAAEYPTIERGCLHPHVADGAGDRFCAFEFVTTRRAR